MSFAIALSDEQWELVADLFDPPGRRGAPAVIPRRAMVEALLFICRTGCQLRYLPERYGTWTAVWAQWRRWRANGVWAQAMARLVAIVRVLHAREPAPSMAMVDAQMVKGGRYGPTFHEPGGRGWRPAARAFRYASLSALTSKIGIGTRYLRAFDTSPCPARQLSRQRRRSTDHGSELPVLDDPAGAAQRSPVFELETDRA